MNIAALHPRQAGKTSQHHGLEAKQTMQNYWRAKAMWDGMPAVNKQALLKRWARDQALAARSYPYLPREVRQDIQPALLKAAAANNTPAPTKHYWWEDA